MADKIEITISDEAAKGVSRRAFIKGVITSGVAVSSANYLFRASNLLGQPAASVGERLITLERERPAAARGRDEAGNAGMDSALQTWTDRHEAGLRPRRMRRLHRPDRRRASLLLFSAYPHRARQEGSNHRRAGES